MITISEEEYLDAGRRMVGFCRACKAERECCEPDAEHYPCEECGEREVFGAEVLLIMGELDFS